MTNEMIIFANRVALMKSGKIGSTGEIATITYKDVKGKDVTEEIHLPEEIHTFDYWKRNGRKVKKGEHAKASFQVWKPCKFRTETETDTGETETVDTQKMFLKVAYFFTFDQTEPATR